jgi:predicted phage terminase large subunit-like protein
LASWNDAQSTWDMAMFGLRLGQHPRWLVTTTPRPLKLLKELLAREGKDVVVTRGSTFDNAANLAPTFLEAIRKRYEGTRLGRQELNAELLSDTPGALWQLDWLDRDRVEAKPFSGLERIVVAIDPAVTSGEDADETGIVVAGVANGHAYVLEDLSGRYQPHEWARRAVAAYRRHQADRIIAERNNGGEMVESTIRMVDRNVSFKAVVASRGKVTRAEPVSAMYEQGRVHHIGTFSQLEDQMCAFTSDFDRSRAGYSPDRLDALVWALTELVLEQEGPKFLFPDMDLYMNPGSRRHPFATG